VLFGIFGRRANSRLVFASAICALAVHFGMYYGEISGYHNNPAVPATFALLTSTLVMLVGSALLKDRDG
jgi:SSS family solute:Na+ symporter/sodium/pantothenate symporter